MATVIDAAYGESKGFSQILVGHYENNKLVVDQTQYFRWPEEREELESFADKNSDFDVYFSTCLLSERRRSTETATVTNVVYVDADTCGPENFLIEPSIVVVTSPGHYQLYWMLDQEISAEHAANLAHRMCVKHEDTGCDPSGWIVSKLLRVPGSTHGKTDTEYTVTEENFGLVYSVEEIATPYADVELPVTVTVTSTPIPTDLPLVADVAGRMSAETFGLYNHQPLDGEDWSSLRWRLALDLFREGFTAAEVFVAVRQSRFNKYASNDKKAADPRGDGGLWQEILKAQSTHVTESQVPPDVYEEESSREILFLTDEERASLEPCFVDQFEAWVAKRSPLHARKYSRFLSFFLLACTYGGYAQIAPQPGNMDLNIWGLLLGPSSTTKKTTVLQLMLTVLKAWESRINEEDRGINVGSDFTAEGLNVKLAERDGKVSLIHRDEISGFFREAFTKNYLAGTIERLTALYEGHVLKTMRASASASQSKDARATLNMIGMGIESHTAEVLTSRQFMSGFLPRYIWCVADAPPWQPEHERVSQRVGDEARGAHEDVEVTEFCNQFSRARKKWGVGEKSPILLSPEALERINQFTLDTKYLITGMDNEEILEPSRARMLWNVWKTAALLAIHDRSDRVELKHLLYVLREAETWFADLIRMAKAVASSEFEGQVNAVEQYVASFKGGVHPSRIYRKFAGTRTGDLDEFLRALRLQGRVSRIEEGNYVVND